MSRPAIGFKPVFMEVEGRSVIPGSKQAKWDGKPMRKPKKGELFLSGAKVTAYRAKADMDTEYFIAVEIK